MWHCVVMVNATHKKYFFQHAKLVEVNMSRTLLVTILYVKGLVDVMNQSVLEFVYP